jgi:hypothetical protein
VSEQIIIPPKTEQKIIDDYVGGLKNKDICVKHQLTPPRLYNILNKYNVPKKGPSSHTRFGEKIKCSACQIIKTQTLFPCVKGIYRTICKECHAKKEDLRRPNINPEILKRHNIKSYDTSKKKRLDGLNGILSLDEQIDLWIKKTTTRRSEKRFIERKTLCKETLKTKCLYAKVKYPDLIFCFVSGQNFNRGMIASLDKIDSSKGYVDENVQVIPLWLNSAKLDSTQEQIDDILINYILINENLSNKYEELKLNREQPDWILPIKH